MSTKITLHPSDIDFVENAHELATSRGMVDFVNVVLDGKAHHSDHAPRLRHDGFIEFMGWRHESTKITKIVYYMGAQK